MPRWTLHDLRRTVRSLMARAALPTTLPGSFSPGLCLRSPNELKAGGVDLSADL